MNNKVEEDPWIDLKSFTQARIALGRAGTSLPTKHMLQFKMDHALAKDAIHTKLDVKKLGYIIESTGIPWTLLYSKAENRHEYLKRPDYGRTLSDRSNHNLNNKKIITPKNNLISISVCDGLSSTAVNQHAPDLITFLIEAIIKEKLFTIGHISLVQQGRVAIGDEIAGIIKADYNVTLIGERPGLTSADSMGCYMSYKPNLSFTDDNRNCISNIRPDGLSIEMAIQKIIFMLKQMQKNKLSGVMLKDRFDYTALTDD